MTTGKSGQPPGDEYEIIYDHKADDDLGSLSEREFERIDERIVNLRFDPRPRDTKRVKGIDDSYRIRVGRFRILYRVDNKNRNIVISRIKKRDERTYKP